MKQIQNSYFLSRSISVLLDESWIIAIPLFMANNWSASNLGTLSSVGALGDFLGILIFPWLASRFKSSFLAISADFLQIIALIAASLLFFTDSLTIPSLSAATFFCSFGFALWFASSDTFFASVISKNEVQQLHKKIAIAQNLGPVVGPSLGAFLFSILNLGGLALLNASSFLGQVCGLIVIAKNDHLHPQRKTLLGALKAGYETVSESHVLTYSLIFPIIAKIFVFGFLPFLTFHLKKSGLSDFLIGLYLAPYGAGVLAGSVMYKDRPISHLAKSFRVNSLLMSTLGFILIAATLTNISPHFFPPFVFCLGIFVACYQIQFRSLRQLATTGQNASGVITIQGLIARIGTPLGGLLFGFLFSTKEPMVYFIPLALGLLALALRMANTVVRGYEKDQE